MKTLQKKKHRRGAASINGTDSIDVYLLVGICRTGPPRESSGDSPRRDRRVDTNDIFDGPPSPAGKIATLPLTARCVLSRRVCREPDDSLSIFPSSSSIADTRSVLRNCNHTWLRLRNAREAYPIAAEGEHAIDRKTFDVCAAFPIPATLFRPAADLP